MESWQLLQCCLLSDALLLLRSANFFFFFYFFFFFIANFWFYISVTFVSVFLFQAVLETIRNLMNTECVVPDWLHDIILGYGDQGSAHYSKMPNQIPTLDFNDTFLSLDHLHSCFPGSTIKVTEENHELQVPPFRWMSKVQLRNKGEVDLPWVIL